MDTSCPRPPHRAVPRALSLAALSLLLAACALQTNTRGVSRRPSPASPTGASPTGASPTGASPTGAPSADKTPAEASASGAAGAAAEAKDAQPKPQQPDEPPQTGCIWFPTLIMRQHQGGGTYAEVIHEWDLDLQMSAPVWRRMAKGLAKKNNLTLNRSGAVGPYDCEKAAKLKSPPELLSVIRKKKSEPDEWLAAQYIPGEDWQVETNNVGVPVSKTRAVLVYKRGKLPPSIDLR